MGRSTGSRWRGMGETGDAGPEAPLTVQLLPHMLAAGELPTLVVGEEVELTPAIYAGALRRGYDEVDRWRVDEFGVISVRGGLFEVPVSPADCDCRVAVVDAAGRLAPLNWAGCTPTVGRVRVEGALYLDPELGPGTDHGDAVALCRRRLRVRELRCYRRTAWRPVSPVALPATPSPREVSEAEVYVVELVPVPSPGAVVPAS